MLPRQRVLVFPGLKLQIGVTATNDPQERHNEIRGHIELIETSCPQHPVMEGGANGVIGAIAETVKKGKGSGDVTIPVRLTVELFALVPLARQTTAMSVTIATEDVTTTASTRMGRGAAPVVIGIILARTEGHVTVSLKRITTIHRLQSRSRLVVVDTAAIPCHCDFWINGHCPKCRNQVS